MEDQLTHQQFGEVGGLDVVIVDDGGDARHEAQSCRHVQVEVEGLAEPGNKHHIKTKRLEPNVTFTLMFSFRKSAAGKTSETSAGTFLNSHKPSAEQKWMIHLRL